MIKLYDANSWVRRMIEVDQTGLPLRNLITEVNLQTSILVWDGPGGNERRRKLYLEYKANRAGRPTEIFETLNFYKKVLVHTNAVQVTVPGYEGDDVIAYFAREMHNDHKIEILSTDRDLVALCQYHNVTHAFESESKVPPSDIRLYKSTKGDPSDNIKGIKGFGDKAWEECDKDELIFWFETGCPPLRDVEQTMERFRVSKAVATWMVDNCKSCLINWKIVGFMPPTDEEVVRGMTVGKRDDTMVSEILKRYMQ